MSKPQPKTTRVSWIIPTLGAGGIGPACRYAAEGVAQIAGYEATIVSLHEKPAAHTDSTTGVQYVSLGLTENASHGFLRWLNSHPQDIVITNDVSRIEASFPHFPPNTRHIIQVHDSAAAYQNVAVRNSHYVDGVICVAHHIETQLRSKLSETRLQKSLWTVHNGASFPPAPAERKADGPLQLLFMGTLDPLIKGVFDLVSILEQSVKAGVPVNLTIVGGHSDVLASRLKRKKLSRFVTWTGRVAHTECYRLAAHSDILLMTSRRESFGMVTIEAMCMGCIPIAYDIPSGSQEIIEHQRNGFLLPLGDFRAWATTIKSLHEDRHRLLQISQNAIRHARESFNNRIQAERLVAVFKELQTNSALHPPERKPGLPPLHEHPSPRSKYQLLPSGFRRWVRNTIGSHPRLSYWLLKRR